MNNDDDRLMDRLRAIAAQMDAPPEFVDEAARAALSTRRIDSELAALVLDSTIDASALVRGDDEQIRLLSFETATVSIELQVHESAGTVSLRGLVSGVAGEAVVETAAGRRTTPIGADGWFTIEGISRGLVRLRLRANNGTVLTTSWVTL